MREQKLHFITSYTGLIQTLQNFPNLINHFILIFRKQSSKIKIVHLIPNGFNDLNGSTTISIRMLLFVLCVSRHYQLDLYHPGMLKIHL